MSISQITDWIQLTLAHRPHQAGAIWWFTIPLALRAAASYSEVMMNDVTAENEQFLSEQVAAGAFASRANALNAAVELLRSRTAVLSQIDEGIQDFERGRFSEFDADGLNRFFADLTAELPASPPNCRQ